MSLTHLEEMGKMTHSLHGGSKETTWLASPNSEIGSISCLCNGCEAKGKINWKLHWQLDSSGPLLHPIQTAVFLLPDQRLQFYFQHRVPQKMEDSWEQRYCGAKSKLPQYGPLWHKNYFMLNSNQNPEDSRKVLYLLFNCRKWISIENQLQEESYHHR